MTKEVIDAIATMAEANGLCPEGIKKLRTICLGGAQEKKKTLINGKEARRILGEADGKPVSRPFLATLVKAGRLHQVRITERKIRYDREEIMSLMESGNN